MDIWQILMTPFSWLLKQFCILFDSYGIALILFTIVIKVILFPFSLKGKKGMIQMSILSAQQQEIQKKYPNNREKQQQEIQKLYAENNASPMSGCMWSMIPMFILFPLYAIIRRPMKYLMNLSETATTAVAKALGWADFTAVGTNELTLAAMLNEGNLTAAATAAGATSLFVINFNFLGIDLSQIPNWKFWDGGITWASVGLFLLPVISAALSLVSTIVMNKTNAMNKDQEQNAMAQNKTMLLMMPLMSLWIGFTLPAGLCVYWIANSVLTMGQELICGKMLKKDYEEAQRKMAEAAEAAKAEEKERRRQAAERKAAALADKKSAKKVQQPKKEKNDGPAVDKSASRVGMRQYARGRAYDPNRYPITPYTDINLKAQPVDEEPVEEVLEDTMPVAETPAVETSTVEAPIVEEVAAESPVSVEEQGDYEAPYAEED